ncbi:putative Tic20 family protein [Eubacterium multiforme]|uniref:Tic20 family protein n=1 Tax=Eubacterium multiforme TaxID=83339 RepID=A0ABT9UX79_9FIRM|nr:putative Tic20 family protein [Eubacterium multiforme]
MGDSIDNKIFKVIKIITIIVTFLIVMANIFLFIKTYNYIYLLTMILCLIGMLFNYYLLKKSI